MKRSFSILLLIVYLAMLYMPYIPYIHFFISNTENATEQIIDKSEKFFSSKILIGDICYLKALKKRANNNTVPVHKTKQISIINTNILEFITPIDIDSKIKPNNNIFEFGEYSYIIIENTTDVDIPPPKSPSFS